ncbi:MAG TPA: hypothetical protein VM864_15765 [Pyrinomonadaceae bacterium]|jgi:hypothetical protein|nr:hypothetical protein [Pyrinomonadaceae bacterium]
MTDEARNTAAADSETPAASASADAAARGVRESATTPSRGGLGPREGVRYRVEELFAFHDRAFVENAFRAALGRAPGAAEFEAALSDLRASRRGKREIIEDLVFCEEGGRSGAAARIEGVRDPRLKRRLRALPVVGYLWQLLAGLARLPRLMRHQREFEAYAHAQQQLLADRLDEQERRTQASIAEQVRVAMAERFEADVSAHIADAREAVLMLSDALASLSAHHEQAVKQRERIEARLAASLGAHQQGIEELQNALNSQQSALEATRRELEGQRQQLGAHEEFLIQEQHAIVEAQKAALAEFEERVRGAEAAARRALEGLTGQGRAPADEAGAPPVAREA